MIKISIFLAVVLVAAGIGCDKIIGFDDVDPIEEANVKKLNPYFLGLSMEMHKKLSKEEAKDPANCMKFAKERLNKLTSGCLGACSFLRKSEKKALELFVSLENTVGRCDTESYEILLKNKLVYDFKGYVFNIWTFHVLSHYLAEHAKHCRPIYRQRFAHKKASVYHEDFERLEKSLATLNIYDFGLWGEHDIIDRHGFDLVGMSKPDFTSESARRSLVKIVQQIGEQIRTGSNPSVAKLAIPKTVLSTHRPVKTLLNKYLFEPCLYYRDLFATELNEARFEAALEDGEAQREYIHDDQEFHQALITNRVCASLLEKQEELYEPFYHAWDYMLNPQKSDWSFRW